MTAPKLPSPIDALTEENQITSPWYQYLLGADHTWRQRVNIVEAGTTTAIIRNREITELNTTGANSYTLERPDPGCRATIILTIGTTHAGPVLAVAATDVAIGPSGQNALSFPTSASTYDYVELVGVSTAQYYIAKQTTTVSVTASS